MKWKCHYMNCPGCRIPVQTNAVGFRATMVRIEGTCAKCHKELFMESPLSEVLPPAEDPIIPGFDLASWEPKGKYH